MRLVRQRDELKQVTKLAEALKPEDARRCPKMPERCPKMPEDKRICGICRVARVSWFVMDVDRVFAQPTLINHAS